METGERVKDTLRGKEPLFTYNEKRTAKRDCCVYALLKTYYLVCWHSVLVHDQSMAQGELFIENNYRVGSKVPDAEGFV